MPSELTTSPLWAVVNWAILGLMLYAGIVGLLLTLIPEGTAAHSWVRRVLMPSALSVLAFLIVAGMLMGGLAAFVIAKSIS